MLKASRDGFYFTLPSGKTSLVRNDGGKVTRLLALAE